MSSDIQPEEFHCPNCKKTAIDGVPCKCGRSPMGEWQANQRSEYNPFGRTQRERNRDKRKRQKR